ncbi:hypothetical protein ABIF65_002164 [Bradyrhizobium japonicum]|uniref:hypothetical protein n=1 Tax=Bradyrhizobium TaxID=374 RepID=UPI00040EBADB|nr:MULTISPECIES: hypothetical protein [Bradyrhizobium]MBR0879351.1 hypothetical protein [Bradyrhizobium liaoningense]MBR0999899.1 hypothetical protein [Bradyrhizobium liaoningense]MBR1029949.1 hypothetical protein [Bradyrhizobium liaoningense]MBR1069532.1 hypothetical protein [Bradyrhizobium liaoningense]MCP1740661.1 hypothetical protein [Bradyrhizobium japonicum]
MHYRSYSVTREKGRFVAFDPNEPEAFKILSRDLRRLKAGIDALWLPCVIGRSHGLADESGAPRWRREWENDPVGEVDLDVQYSRGAC